MKRIFVVLLSLLMFNNSAYADNVYLHVNGEGVILNRIECSREVCGDANSLYSRLTLQAGEKYIKENDSIPQPEQNPYILVVNERVGNEQEEPIWEVEVREPIQVTEATKVIKVQETEYKPNSNQLTLIDETTPVKQAEIDIKIPDVEITPEVPTWQQAIDELRIFLDLQLSLLAFLFANWVWQ